MTTTLQKASQSLNNKDLSSFKEIIDNSPELIEKACCFWVHKAADTGFIEALEFLQNLGCDLNCSDRLGTALSKAAAMGQTASVIWLLENGASLELDKEDSNKDPLFSAIQSGEVEIAKLLIDKGIDTTYKYPCGRDALAFAKQWNCTEVIELIGGDPDEPREPWVKTSLPDFTAQKMTEDKLSGIEKELNIKIPEYFRSYLSNSFPTPLFQPATQDNDDWQWLGDDYLMFHTVRSFIAYNSENSRDQNKTLRHPGYLVFGTNGGGDSWCIKLDGKDENVHFYNHELEEFSNTGLTVTQHVETLLNDIQT